MMPLKEGRMVEEQKGYECEVTGNQTFSGWDSSKNSQAEEHWSDDTVVLCTTSVAAVLTSSDLFPSPCALEVGEAVPEIPNLLPNPVKSERCSADKGLICSVICGE